MAVAFADVRQRADILFDHRQLDAVIARMAEDIDTALAGEPAVMVTVMNGGMVFAAQLALAMRSELEFDYVHATRYRDNHAGGLDWLHRPSPRLAGRQVLLVDDIFDQGVTLKAVHDECRTIGASRVWIATLCRKQRADLTGSVADFEPDFNGVELPDRYVFGYGLDYAGQGRNLPGIYAAADADAGAA